MCASIYMRLSSERMTATRRENNQIIESLPKQRLPLSFREYVWFQISSDPSLSWIDDARVHANRRRKSVYVIFISVFLPVSLSLPLYVRWLEQLRVGIWTAAVGNFFWPDWFELSHEFSLWCFESHFILHSSFNGIKWKWYTNVIVCFFMNQHGSFHVFGSF